MIRTHKKVTFVLFLAIAIKSIFAMAEQVALSPQSFAYGLPLIVKHSGAFYSIKMPGQVYQYVNSADLSDVRVFDANNQIVPALVQTAQTQTTTSQMNIDFFPVNADQNDLKNNLNLTIHHRNNRIIVDSGLPSPVTADRLEQKNYLLDCKHLINQPSTVLSLTWSPTPTHNWILPLTIMSSDDLKHWHTLDTASLAELEYQGNTTLHNRIQLSQINDHYLLLVPQQKYPVLKLKTVQASFSTDVQQPLQWNTQTVIQNPADQNYVFDTQGQYPVQSIRLAHLNGNFSSQIQVFSRSHSDDSWNLVSTNTLYQLENNSKKLSQLSLEFSPDSDRYWKIETSPTLGKTITLQIGWQPATISFLANDSNEYLLTFGNLLLDMPDSSAAPMIEQLNQLGTLKQSTGQLKVGTTLQTLAGMKALTMPTLYQPYILWAILILGVVILAVMTFLLMKKLK
jgi:hypothetical protein